MSIEDTVDRYGQMIYRLALSRLGSREDAEDVTQEVFMRLFRSETTFLTEEHEKAWQLGSAAASTWSQARLRNGLT